MYYYLIPAYIYLALGVSSFVVMLFSRTKKRVLAPKGVSIIVAARNEECGIEKCVNSILNNKTDFPIELIVVDDHSIDSTWEILNGIEDDRLVCIKAVSEGKKSAVKKGVDVAVFDIVLQTDADSVVGDFWIESMLESLADKRMILGPVFTKSSKGLLASLQSLEFSVLQVLTAFFAKINSSIMANGANMMFYKEDYLEFVKEGYGNDYASGDDQFFMHFIKQKFKGNRIGYCFNKNALVLTDTPNTYKEVLQQRKRWATKMGGITDFTTMALSLLLFIVYFSLFVSGVSALYLPDFLYTFLLLVGMKFIAETLITTAGLMFFNRLKLIVYIPLMFVVYPFHLIMIFLQGKGAYNWKGRKVS